MDCGSCGIWIGIPNIIVVVGKDRSLLNEKDIKREEKGDGSNDLNHKAVILFS